MAHPDQQLGQEVNRVIGATSFNGQKILSSNAGTRQINTGPGSNDTLDLTTPDLRNDQQPERAFPAKRPTS